MNDSEFDPESESDSGDDSDFDADSPKAARARPSLVRLNKWLADQGVASRRKCDVLIATGHVSVDGATVTELGTKIDPAASRVEVDSAPIGARPARKRYYLLNKPRNVFCTSDELENRTRAIDLIDDRDKGRIYTVGRLDEDTTGLVVLTNDGEFANRVMHPRYGVPKTYLLKVVGYMADEAIQQVRGGVRLAEGMTGGARVVVIKRTDKQSLLEVTINEGVNREVRRIFATVGYKVARLHRSRLGPLDDRGIKIGSWRPLTRSEIESLLDPSSSGAEDPKIERLQRKRGPARKFQRAARRPVARQAKAYPQHEGAKGSFGKANAFGASGSFGKSGAFKKPGSFHKSSSFNKTGRGKKVFGERGRDSARGGRR